MFPKAAALQSPRMRPLVNLELNVPAPNASFVISDSVLLLQYLSNLLSNAAKFTSVVSLYICKLLSDELVRTGFTSFSHHIASFLFICLMCCSGGSRFSLHGEGGGTQLA